MAKAFSFEDGNLANKPINASKGITYKDIDCSFVAKPSKDIYKKTDAAAVKQAVRNLLLTRRGEKPFQPFYGSSLYDILFELSTEVEESDVTYYVKNTINNFEPRAQVEEVLTNFSTDYNSADVTVVFRVVNTLETVSVTVTISRVR